MASDPKKKPEGADGQNGGHFDAVKAAEELAASLGIDGGDRSSAASAAYEDTLEREVEQLNALLDAKDAKIAQLEAALAKTAGARDAAHDEIERASARIVKEELKKVEQKQKEMLLAFLDILDDFERAFEAITGGGHPETVLAGIKLVHQSFVAKLRELGVTHSPALAAVFDPTRHDAITLVPIKDPAQDGKVVAVVREGYMIGEECLRPARVAVGKLG